MKNHFPLYFISGFIGEPTLAGLRSSVLADVVVDLFTDDQLAIQRLPAGPDGNPGLLFCVSPEGRLVDDFGFHFQRQEWKQVPDNVWIGWHTGTVITPEDLQRRRCPVADSERMEAADGTIWEVPVLRDPLFDHPERGEMFFFNPLQHRTSLQTAYYRNAAGQWEFTVAKEYQSLFAQSRKWFEWLLHGAESGKPIDFGYADVFEYAVAVLSLRYRYGLHLNDALQGRFLTTEQASEIMRISCGWSVIARHLASKKKSGFADLLT